MPAEGVEELQLALSREAVSPRNVVRPAAVWRLFQEAAVQASSRRGWPPQRYAAEGVGFVLARMTVRHHAEVPDGDPVQARTWVRAFRRRIISEREVRLSLGGHLLASASQRWVHVSAALKLQPASDAFAQSIPVHDAPNDPPVSLPELPAAEGRAHVLAFPCWHAWLDPLGHVNHPTYLEWCDEHTSRLLAAAGVPPHQLQPVAEQVHYRAGVRGGDRIRVQTSLMGTTADGTKVALRHEIEDPQDGRVYARAVTVRRLASRQPLAHLLR